VHRKYIPIYTQQDATLHSLFISGNCSTFFKWYFHPLSGTHTTVFTASGICHTVIATCRCCGGVGTPTPPLLVGHIMEYTGEKLSLGTVTLFVLNASFPTTRNMQRTDVGKV
jgi:hypothetical protein